MAWLQFIGTVAFILAVALWWTWLSFSIARWVGRLVGKHLPITPRALTLRPWIRWSKPLLLASGFGAIAGPIGYISGWGLGEVLSGTDWVLYGVGCLINFLVGLGRGTAQRLGLPDETQERLIHQWTMAAGEDLEQVGYTAEQISRKCSEASRDEVAKLIGTLVGLRDSRATMSPQQWRETVITFAADVLGEPEAITVDQSSRMRPLATKVTYSAGKFSQVKLPDGSRYLVEVLNGALSVRKLTLAAIPGEVIWRYDLYQNVRTPFSTTNLARELLDLVLDSIINCQSENDLRDKLSKDTESYIYDYFMKANLKSMSESHTDN